MSTKISHAAHYYTVHPIVKYHVLLSYKAKVLDKLYHVKTESIPNTICDMFYFNILGKKVSWLNHLHRIIVIHISSRWIFCNFRGVPWCEGGWGMIQWALSKQWATKATKIIHARGSSALTCQEAQNLFRCKKVFIQDQFAPLIK